MSDNRLGDDGKRRHFRSERISVVNGKYFFSTREGAIEGPFDTKEEAERELMLFVRKVSGKGIYGSVIHDEPKKS